MGGGFAYDKKALQKFLKVWNETHNFIDQNVNKNSKVNG